MTINRRELLQIGPLALAGLGASGARPGVDGRRRARQLGVRIGRLRPGTWNAITDVPGVRVGHATVVRGSGPLEVGRGPVRTGVTAVWPHDGIVDEYLPCGCDAPNGNGEVTGLIQAARLGVLGSPICLTNTSSVGMVYDALLERLPQDDLPAVEPLVGETWDAFLNDIEGRHVHREHVFAALDGAAGGAVEEGSVGGGTGMICYGFKGGIGTASRRLPAPLGDYTVGVLVQANHGARELLRIDGVAVGEAISDLRPEPDEAAAPSSILMVIATDVPLLDYQLDRLARRAVHGLAKTGSISGNSSGDFTLAFSTANRIPRRRFWAAGAYPLASLAQADILPLFEAAAEATEEAIVNALFLADDMEGRDGHLVHALPLTRTLDILDRHRRLFPALDGVENTRA
jgi:D-aminopeptidase